MAERLFDPRIDSVADVLAIRAKALSLVKEGKTIMEWESVNSKVVKDFPITLERILVETRLFLKVADPATYGRRITRTQVSFTY